jgi:multiple antibiotic resistance protein
MFVKILISVFMIMGPFTVIPTFVSLTHGMSQRQINRIARRSIYVAFGILFVSAIAGEKIFMLLGISIPSFKIAGGILILLMGINMLHAKRSAIKATDSEIEEAMERNDISVFPIGTPLIAGPGAISTVVLFSTVGSRVTSVTFVLISVIISSIIIHYLLKYSHLIYRVLGQTGTNIMTRLMGLILSAMAIEFIVDGVRSIFNYA